MVTAELALAVPTLLLVLSICLSVVAVVAARVRCIDAAAVAARLTARGETSQTVLAQVHESVPRAAVTVRRLADGYVDVDVRQHLRFPVLGVLLPGVTVSEHVAVPDESAHPTDDGRDP
jgi:hypothetical protein